MKSDNHVPTFRAGRTSETAGSVSGLWSPGQPSRRVVPLVPPPLCCRLIVPNRGTDSELPSAAELTSLHCPQALAKTLQEGFKISHFITSHVHSHTQIHLQAVEWQRTPHRRRAGYAESTKSYGCNAR